MCKVNTKADCIIAGRKNVHVIKPLNEWGIEIEYIVDNAPEKVGLEWVSERGIKYVVQDTKKTIRECMNDYTYMIDSRAY